MSDRSMIFLLAAVALFPCVGLAQSGFRVNPGTGLELEEPASSRQSARGTRGEASQGDRRPTEITASKETTFDEKTRVAVFIGDVTVNDEQFNLTCEKLTAYLKKPAAEGEKEPAVDKAAAGPEGGGLERVVAEGKVLIVQEKPDASGKVTRYVGRASRAEYVAATGDVTLTGWPQIQQGINNQVATEEGTVMILNRNGHLKTVGGSKTVIKESTDPRKTGNGTARNGKP